MCTCFLTFYYFTYPCINKISINKLWLIREYFFLRILFTAIIFNKCFTSHYTCVSKINLHQTITTRYVRRAVYSKNEKHGLRTYLQKSIARSSPPSKREERNNSTLRRPGLVDYPAYGFKWLSCVLGSSNDRPAYRFRLRVSHTELLGGKAHFLHEKKLKV